MVTIGVLVLCLALGHVLLPALSAVTGRRRLNYRLTRGGRIVDSTLGLVGVLLVVTGILT